MSLNEQLAKDYHQFSSGQFKKGIRLLELIAPKPNENVLDLGCGTGELTYELARLVQPHGKVIALDPDFERIKLAQKNTPSDIQNISWHNIGAHDYKPAANEQFDVIFSNFVLHWIPNPQLILNKLSAALKPHGRLGIQLVFDHPEFVKAITMASQKEKDIVLEKYHLFAQDEWQSMVINSGLTIEKIEPAEDYYFKDLDAFLDWWEATTHGTFSRKGLSQDIKLSFEEKYQNGLHLYGKETLCLLATK